MEYIPKVLQAVAGEDFTIYLYFSDGSVRLYDAKPLLQQGLCIIQADRAITEIQVDGKIFSCNSLQYFWNIFHTVLPFQINGAT